MSPHPVARIADCFVDLIDPRRERCRRHALLDITTIAVCAVLGGADTMVEIADWGRTKRNWLEDWLALPNGIPSHDTFGRVFARLDPTQVQAGLFTLAQQLVATAQRLVLAQRVVDTHDNEISTLPDLLRQFCLTGQISTIDAMGCQTDLAAQIVTGKGDYVLALKGQSEGDVRAGSGRFHYHGPARSARPDRGKGSRPHGVAGLRDDR